MSELIAVLEQELLERGDCELVMEYGDLYIGVESAELIRTPYTAAAAAACLVLTEKEL